MLVADHPRHLMSAFHPMSGLTETLEAMLKADRRLSEVPDKSGWSGNDPIADI